MADLFRVTLGHVTNYYFGKKIQNFLSPPLTELGKFFSCLRNITSLPLSSNLKFSSTKIAEFFYMNLLFLSNLQLKWSSHLDLPIDTHFTFFRDKKLSFKTLEFGVKILLRSKVLQSEFLLLRFDLFCCSFFWYSSSFLSFHFPFSIFHFQSLFSSRDFPDPPGFTHASQDQVFIFSDFILIWFDQEILKFRGFECLILFRRIHRLLVIRKKKDAEATWNQVKFYHRIFFQF